MDVVSAHGEVMALDMDEAGIESLKMICSGEVSDPEVLAELAAAVTTNLVIKKS